MAQATARVDLDQAALDLLLRGRSGAVGRMMAGFAGLATREVRNVADARTQRRTGRYRQGITSNYRSPPQVDVIASAPYSRIIEEGSRPHVIRVRRARVLTDGVTFFGTQVSHPGTRAQHVLRDGVAAAGRRLRTLADNR